MVALCPDVTYWWRRWEELAHSCNLSNGFHSEQPPSKSNETYITSPNTERGRSSFYNGISRLQWQNQGFNMLLFLRASVNMDQKEWTERSDWYYTYLSIHMAVRSELDGTSALVNDFFHCFTPTKYYGWLRLGSRVRSFWLKYLLSEQSKVILPFMYLQSEILNLASLIWTKKTYKYMCYFCIFVCPLKFSRQTQRAVSSTGLRRTVTSAMVHLISHYYHRGFGSIKELPGRKRITARLFISLSDRTWLSLINCDSQAAADAARRDKPRH